MLVGFATSPDQGLVIFNYLIILIMVKFMRQFLSFSYNLGISTNKLESMSSNLKSDSRF